MILIWGVPSESPTRLVAEAAERLGIAFLVLSQREAAHCSLKYVFDQGNLSGEIAVGSRRVELREIAGFYLRCMDPQLLPENRRLMRAGVDETGERLRSLLFHEALFELTDLLPTRVMNRTRPMASNLSKPYQLQLIAQAGLAVPDTLITNDPGAAMAYHRQERRVIFKSISSVRSIVRALEGPRLGQLGRIRSLPVQFQPLLPGTDVRVHIAGNELFATEIASPAVDYRYAGRDGQSAEMSRFDLPTEISQRCFELSRRLQLPLCGIDLKRTPGGEYYCFEVNPSPGFSYFQEQSGQDIAGGIVRYLAGVQDPAGA